MKRNTSFLILTLVLSAAANAQRAPRPDGPPRGGPPRGERPMGEMMRPDGPPRDGWIVRLDVNENGTLEGDEFRAAVDRTFVELDRNGNGTIEPGEPAPPRPPAPGQRPGNDGKKLLPPFFFDDLIEGNEAVTRAAFDAHAMEVFRRLDKDADGGLTKAEAGKGPRHRGAPHPPPPGMAPNARFIGAELRFGDKLVKDQPFSADIVIEDTRRLFDGTTVTMKRSGAIYRDREGRTRREQPLEMIGGINLVGDDNKPQRLVFIHDFASNTQVFLDLTNKVARKGRLHGGPPPIEPGEPDDARTEALGTSLIEGVKAEGTRTTFEIPIGQIGNEKPIKVITERWFSPELQALVLSRHVDPIAGEHVFKLINIKRVEPAAELFTVPTGFRVENDSRP